MITYISILRAINVGGRNIVPMADLKALYEVLGLQKVVSYIQSGNVVFESTGDTATLAARIASAFDKKFGFPAPVMVRTLAEWQEVVANSPFAADPGIDPKYLHVTFLGDAPGSAALGDFQQFDLGRDKVRIIGRAAYLCYSPVDYGNSKLTNNLIEAKLKVPATTRNWRTVNKLLELATG